MTNPRSAGNAWAKIRNKLNSATGDATTPKKTPQKKKLDKGNTDGHEEDSVVQSDCGFICPALNGSLILSSPEEDTTQADSQEAGRRRRTYHTKEARSACQSQEDL